MIALGIDELQRLVEARRIWVTLYISLRRSDGSAAVSVSPLSGWYLVQCKPQKDGRVEEHLTRQGK